MAGEFKNIDPDEFERLVANIWDGLGWNTTVTSSARDDGIDVEATRWTEDGKEKHLIQAKRYDSKVSAPEIREYAGLYQQESDADKVIVVSTGGFTEPAKETASKTGVELINERELIEKYEQSSLSEQDDSQQDSATQNGKGSDSEDEYPIYRVMVILKYFLPYMIIMGLVWITLNGVLVGGLPRWARVPRDLTTIGVFAYAIRRAVKTEPPWASK